MFFLAIAVRVQLLKLPGLILLTKVYWDDRRILKSAKFAHLPSFPFCSISYFSWGRQFGTSRSAIQAPQPLNLVAK
jgi:hypothetical protein